MKRFLTLLAAIMIVMTAVAQSAGIVLSYNKGQELKFYGANQLDKAIEDAELNDTIYFGPGQYDLSVLPEHNGDWSKKLIKPLTFIGTGSHSEGTRLIGEYNIDIVIDSSLNDANRFISFEGINLEDAGISSYSDLTELKLVNVKLYRFVDKYSDVEDQESIINRLIIDRSNIQRLYLANFLIRHVSVNNTKITYYLSGGCDSSYGVATFDHCFIQEISEDFVGLVKHSLIHTTSAGEQASFDNSGLYSDENENSSKTECIFLSYYIIDRVDDDPSSLGNCNDGTAYGTLGGTTPYTLYPQYPTADVSDNVDTGKPNSFVEYDALNKKLTISVKLLGE